MPGSSGIGPRHSTQDLAKDARAGAIVALAVAVSGVLLGLAWLWLAPRIPMISDGKAVYLKDSEGEQAIGIDGWFTLLGAAFGLLSALVVFLLRRTGGIAVVIGLAVGAVLASVVGWRLGMALGPTSDIVAHAKEVGSGKVFDGPLKLQAKGALLAWPALAMAGHLILTAAFGPRDPSPPLPDWPGWGSPESADPPPAPGKDQS
ncbi:hypothetical protein GCM10012280_06600 [Wenjunlia tyrosinilytica]|uniref:ABC transporter permease n=1 Tax=Wenjunlia tyrosinilytica TaxID=1544741 RepID=A0A918DT37_9ACTN|nr:hypothetical protein GCM10012280_06600 [Wenjunlia tyrosinilytica]